MFIGLTRCTFIPQASMHYIVEAKAFEKKVFVTNVAGLSV
jgi:hypothetical protein